MRMRADGMHVEQPFDHGDQLMHALIASGGHDPEFLTDEQLADSPLRLPVADYIDWYRTLPDTSARGIEERWGPPPGDRYLDGEDFVDRGPGARQRARRDPAAARLRRGSGGHLPRPGAAAHAPLPRLLPLARRRVGRGRDRAPGQARHARVAARARCSRCQPAARPTRRSATCRSCTRSSSTTPARACRPSAARTR